MFRDRTNLYISYRQSYVHRPTTIAFTSTASQNDEAQGLMDVGIEMEELPPQWIDISDDVDEILESMNDDLKVLDKLHRKNALPGFDDKSREEREIEQLTMKITSQMHKCHNMVKSLDSLKLKDSASQKMAINMKISLASKIQSISARFRKMQSSYLKALKSGAGEVDSTFMSKSPYDDEQGDEVAAQGDIEFSQTMLQEEQEMPQEYRQRERDITKIAQGIIELADIFKDLQTMVIDQGTLLDRIDYNVETMHHNVKEADGQLVTATRYQKRTQKCKIILLLILIVVGLIIVLLVKPRRHVKEVIVEKPGSDSSGGDNVDGTGNRGDGDSDSVSIAIKEIPEMRSASLL